MTPQEQDVLDSIRRIGMPALNQWKYRRDTPLGDFARAVIELRKSKETMDNNVPKGRLVPR